MRKINCIDEEPVECHFSPDKTQRRLDPATSASFCFTHALNHLLSQFNLFEPIRENELINEISWCSAWLKQMPADTAGRGIEYRWYCLRNHYATMMDVATQAREFFEKSSFNSLSLHQQMQLAIVLKEEGIYSFCSSGLLYTCKTATTDIFSSQMITKCN